MDAFASNSVIHSLKRMNYETDKNRLRTPYNDYVDEEDNINIGLNENAKCLYFDSYSNSKFTVKRNNECIDHQIMISENNGQMNTVSRNHHYLQSFTPRAYVKLEPECIINDEPHKDDLYLKKDDNEVADCIRNSDFIGITKNRYLLDVIPAFDDQNAAIKTSTNVNRYLTESKNKDFFSYDEIKLQHHLELTQKKLAIANRHQLVETNGINESTNNNNNNDKEEVIVIESDDDNDDYFDSEDDILNNKTYYNNSTYNIDDIRSNNGDGKYYYNCNIAYIGNVDNSDYINGAGNFDHNNSNKYNSASQSADVEQKFLNYNEKDSKPHQCFVCKRIVATRYNLKRHMMIHTGERPHGCDLCTKRFREFSDLKKHRRIHSQENNYLCMMCHCNRPTFDNPTRCLYCEQTEVFTPKSTTNYSNIFNQRNTHGRKMVASPTMIINFKKTIINSTSLVTNNTTNITALSPTRSASEDIICLENNKRAYICPVCDRIFGSSSNLKRHVMIHTGEKPFQCTLCNRSFRELSTLRKHMLTHEIPMGLGFYPSKSHITT